MGLRRVPPILRVATRADATAAAEVYIRSRRELILCAPLVHSDEAVHEWFRERLIPTGRATVAVVDGRIVGLSAVSEHVGVSFIDHLYVHPQWVGRGIGTQLLVRAQTELSPPIRLYTFQANHRARAFYERHDFRAIAEGDGSTNEERCPDVLYEWCPRTGG